MALLICSLCLHPAPFTGEQCTCTHTWHFRGYGNKIVTLMIAGSIWMTMRPEVLHQSSIQTTCIITRIIQSALCLWTGAENLFPFTVRDVWINELAGWPWIDSRWCVANNAWRNSEKKPPKESCKYHNFRNKSELRAFRMKYWRWRK